MTFGQELVSARKKGDKLAFWLVVLIAVEVFVLGVVCGALGLDKGVTGWVVILTIVSTFFAAYFYQFRIIDPLIEKGGDLFEKNAVDRDLQKGLMDKVRGG
ncbi:MAG: hypothetical protein GY832_00530 [Chloroflexi bacterium]|nr:hypothetical protein [Chloroflexota bacterium]